MKKRALIALCGLWLAFLPSLATAQEEAKISVLSGLTVGDQNGQMFQDKNLRGKYLLVHLGFSRCTKECTSTLADMTQVMKDLGKDAENVRPVFISLDPGDTAESLKAFLKPYDARIIALHGTQKDIDKLIETYQLYTATAINQQTGQVKVMDHAPNLFLFDKNAQYRGDFAPNESAKDIGEDIRLAMQKE